jgi:hypothetical protein
MPETERGVGGLRVDTTPFDLRRILAPIQAETFLSETWEKRPLIIRREDGGHYAGLFSLADVDTVIAFSRPRFTEPGAFPGRPPPSRTCVQGWLPDQTLAPSDFYPGIAELRQVHAQGKTLIIRAMQHRWPAIALLCRNLENVFHCPVHANLYLTPPTAQGFEAHIDAHEVFALQLHGVKHWRLYGPAVNLPLANEKAIIPRDRLGPVQEVCLEPGDLLYIPRGHAHEAFTADHSSLHLTVGVNVHRWADLLHQAVEEMSRRDARFRESLRPGALLDGDAAPALGRRLQELLGALADGARPEAAVRRLGDEFLDELVMLPDGRFGTPAGTDVDTDTVLARSPGAICRCVAGPDGALIQFPGGQVSGPARIATALQFVARSERFAVRELPDSLGAEGKLVLARRLIREGLLTIVSPAKDRAGRTPTPEVETSTKADTVPSRPEPHPTRIPVGPV